MNYYTIDSVFLTNNTLNYHPNQTNSTFNNQILSESTIIVLNQIKQFTCSSFHIDY